MKIFLLDVTVVNLPFWDLLLHQYFGCCGFCPEEEKTLLLFSYWNTCQVRSLINLWLAAWDIRRRGQTFYASTPSGGFLTRPWVCSWTVLVKFSICSFSFFDSTARDVERVSTIRQASKRSPNVRTSLAFFLQASSMQHARAFLQVHCPIHFWIFSSSQISIVNNSV